MAKMASLDAEQREVPWEYVMWRRLAIVSALVWVSAIATVITLFILIVT
jgi:hypothetical protein